MYKQGTLYIYGRKYTMRYDTVSLYYSIYSNKL